MRKNLESFFVICLFISLGLASLLVIGQIIGLVLQNGNIVLLSKQLFAKLASIFAAFAGLTTFVLSKISTQVKDDDNNKSKQHPNT